MNFNTLKYFAFLPAAVLLYFVCPRKWRNGLLLIISYGFYMCWDAKFALLLLTSTVTTYAAARLIENCALNRKKLWLVASLIINLGILLFFKYFNFFSTLTTNALAYIGLQADPFLLKILLPVGISFYTFQALGYTIDVYRGDNAAERNFIDFALFVSFFPQLVSGPIARAKDLLPQFKETHRFSMRRVFDGALLILWGLFKKMVIADNLAVIVGFVFASSAATGIQQLVAALAFTVELYCDFSAYTDIARGSANMLGFRLMQNFDAPFFAPSIKDFWRRWHISLSTWFRDYLYIPLGGNRRSKARTCVNVMIVFLVSGIWHGAAVTFVIWGALHGLYQVASILTAPYRRRLLAALKIPPENRVLTAIKTLFTFTLVSLTFVFFRADTVAQALSVLKGIFLLPVTGLVGVGLSGLPMGYLQLAVYSLAVAVSFGVDRLSHTRRLRLKPIVEKPAARYACYFAIICAIIIFGYYGSGFDPQEFIYFKF